MGILVSCDPRTQLGFGNFVRDSEGHQIPFSGGVLVPVSENWPRTDLAALPMVARSAHDVTGDNIADVVLTTRVTLHDADDNGVADSVLLRVVGAEAIQSDVACECGPHQRAQAIERVAAGL
jgi:hypothetical protein